MHYSAKSLKGIIEIGSRGLDPDEVEELARAACAKLLDLASYRSYELEIEDCAFVRDTIARALPQMEPDNRRYCGRMLSGTAARLAHGGKISEALRLAPMRLYPAVAARLALRAAVPPSVRHVLQQAVGRSPSVK